MPRLSRIGILFSTLFRRVGAAHLWAIIVGAVIWTGKTQALPALLIEAKIAAHLSDADFIEIKAIKISNLHNVKDFSFGLFGGFGPVGVPNGCNWDIASLQDKLVFGSNHISYFCSLPFCQGKRINYLVRLGSIWTVVLNHNATRGHISSIEDGNAHAPNYRLIGRIRSEGRIAEINKSAISQPRCLIGFIQNPSSEPRDESHNNRENSEPPSPARHHLLIALVLGLVPFATMTLAFKGAEYADDRGWLFRWVPLLGFLVVSLSLTHRALTTFNGIAEKYHR